MDSISFVLGKAAEAMKICTETILHEGDLASTMTSQQYESLVQTLRAQGVQKHCILHWLELVPTALDQNQEGKRAQKSKSRKSSFPAVCRFLHQRDLMWIIGVIL